MAGLVCTAALGVGGAVLGTRGPDDAHESNAATPHPATAPGRSAPASVRGRDAFWSTYRVNALDAYRYQSLRAQALDADVVVQGQFVGIAVDRVFASDHPDGALTIGVAILRIDDVLRGSVTRGAAIEVELTVPGPEGQARRNVARGASALPTDLSVVFLRDLDKEVGRLRAAGAEVAEPPVHGRYGVLNSYGVWTRSERTPLDTPLSAGTSGESMYSTDLTGVRSIAALAARIREYVRAP